MKRAAELMRRYAGATIAEGYVDCFPAPKPQVTIELAPREVERLLGVAVPARGNRGPPEPPAVRGGGPTDGDDPMRPLAVHVPRYRNDVTIPADLVEEVARMIGYDRIPETLLSGALPPQAVNYDFRNRERVRDLLVGLRPRRGHHLLRSLWHKPAAVVRTKTSRGPGLSICTSSISSLPGTSLSTAARMRGLLHQS